MQIVAILVAAGRGHRAGAGKRKQYRSFLGEPVLRKTLRAFSAEPSIGGIVSIIHTDDVEDYRSCAEGIEKCLPPVFGGATRQQSVFAGLQSLEMSAPKTVLVHDAVRPFPSAALLRRALNAAKHSDAAVPVLPISDTVKRTDASGRIISTLERSELCFVQTPQVFSFKKIIDAHRRAAKVGLTEFPDDAAVAEWAGIPVMTFPGEARNIKLTTPDDFLIAELVADGLAEVRTGTGFDVHAFGPGDRVILGGIVIPHTKSLIGHSDADVLLHAMTDAILGALGEADIGHHFPPSNTEWRGASSDGFLVHAIGLVKARGGRLAHLDSTILCEMPKIGPHRDAIRTNIATIAGLDINCVSVKATTTEGLGFLGRGEGIAAMATATVRLPANTP